MFFLHKKPRVTNYFSTCRYAICILSLLLGACESSPQRTIIECGGGARFGCPDGMFCDLGSNCGGFDNAGACRIQPGTCPLEETPVCGCDKVTYASACYAHASGVSINYDGPCIVPVQRKESEHKNFDFPDTGTVRAGDVESAGDVVKDNETFETSE